MESFDRIEPGKLQKRTIIGASSSSSSYPAYKYDPLNTHDDETAWEMQRRKRREAWVQRLDWVSRKMHSMFWVGLACGMIYWTNFFRVIWESPLVNRGYLHVAFTGLSFNMSLLFYLAFIADAYYGIKNPWDSHAPNAIPMLILVCVATFVFFMVALYPVWGMMTAVLQFVFFMGFLSSGSLLPSGVLGAILMFVIFFGSFFTSIWIPHEGLAHYKPQMGT